MAEDILIKKDAEFEQINQLYDECLDYLMNAKQYYDTHERGEGETEKYENEEVENEEVENEEVENDYETIEDTKKFIDDSKDVGSEQNGPQVDKINYVNELKSDESLNSLPGEFKSGRLRKLSQTLPKIIITQSNTSLDVKRDNNIRENTLIKDVIREIPKKSVLKKPNHMNNKNKEFNHDYNFEPEPAQRFRTAYGDFPKRLVSKSGLENVALISNVPFEKIRLLNDTFHTLINLRWRWIVTGTVAVHFAIWLVFAVFWYVAALAHDDFDPEPPARACVTGGKDFVTIFLASVEAQTTIGFGDRAIDEECPESIFLFIMQLILGTGLSGVLTCVVYAKLTRPEKLSRDGVGFSKKAVISMRDGRLCLMVRAWDLNYDHIISSEFTAHFINTHRTKEGEVIRYFARSLPLQQKQFLLWPVTLVHEIDAASPLYGYRPQDVADNSYEITVSLKGASASMGTFTQSQSSYMPRELLWGHRFPPVVRYDSYKQKYAIDHSKLDATEPVDTPLCSACELDSSRSPSTSQERSSQDTCPGTPGSFSERVATFHIGRTSSFKKERKS